AQAATPITPATQQPVTPAPAQQPQPVTPTHLGDWDAAKEAAVQSELNAANAENLKLANELFNARLASVNAKLFSPFGFSLKTAPETAPDLTPIGRGSAVNNSAFGTRYIER
ncbi:MAG: hypothetical protein LBQ05_02870, partial [Christensenellaceae bacterium]|nr:hypothetical protein [Christensenellaceae bacterium]